MVPQICSLQICGFFIIWRVMQLDHTETLNSIKKELFSVELKIRTCKDDKELLHKLLRQRYILKQKYDLISKEEELADGQISFGFADEIDIQKL